DQVARVIVAGDVRTPERMVVVAHAKQPLSAEELLHQKKPARYDAGTIAGKTVYLGRQDAFWLPDERTAVFADRATLTTLVERPGGPRLSAEFKEALTRLDPSRGGGLAVELAGLAGKQVSFAQIDLTPLLGAASAR